MPYGASMTLTNPTGRVGSSSRVSSNSGSEVVLGALGVSDSGSLAIDHSTTLGWFLSRATSSRIAWACTSRVRSLIVSGENVV